MPANPLFSRVHSTFYQHVLSTLKVVQKKIKPPSALYLSGLKTVFINTFCPISQIFHARAQIGPPSENFFSCLLFFEFTIMRACLGQGPLIYFVLFAQVRFLDLIIVQEHLGVAFQDDVAGFENVAAVCDGQRFLCVLLY